MQIYKEIQKSRKFIKRNVLQETICAITDRVLPEIKAWKCRTLYSVYPIVWMNAIHYKVTDERGYVCRHTCYIQYPWYRPQRAQGTPRHVHINRVGGKR